MRTLAVVFMMLIPVADMIRDVQSSQCQASNDGTDMSASAHGALQFVVAASDAGKANVAVSAHRASGKQCDVWIAQGDGGFIAYAVINKQIKKEVESQDILAKSPDLKHDEFNEPNGDFRDFAERVVHKGGKGNDNSVFMDYLIALYKKFVDGWLNPECDKAVSLKVYQTGTMRAAALLQLPNEGSEWKLEMESKMRVTFPDIQHAVGFQFLTAQNEATNEGRHFFRDRKFNEVLSYYQSQTINKNEVIGLGIGSSSTRAYAYIAGHAACVRGAGNAILGTEVPHNNVAAAFLTLLQGAAGVLYNPVDHTATQAAAKVYKLVIAFDSIESTMTLVLNFLLKCACGLETEHGQTMGDECPEFQDPGNVCKNTEKVKKQFEGKSRITPKTLVGIAEFAIGDKQASGGSEPARFLLGFAQAIIDFQGDYVIIDDGINDWDIRWVEELISPSGIKKCAAVVP